MGWFENFIIPLKINMKHKNGGLVPMIFRILIIGDFQVNQPLIFQGVSNIRIGS